MASTPAQFRRKTEAYKQPFYSVATADQRAAADRVFGDAIERVIAWIGERQTILDNAELTATGKQKQLSAHGERGDALRRELEPKLRAALADPAEQEQNLIAAVNLDRVWDPVHNGYVNAKPTATDPQAIAEATEARAYWRTLPPAKFREQFREWVLADDPRARVAAADPTGVLVSATDREWALKVRVTRSPFAEQIKVLQAAQRSFGLLFEAIDRELGGSKAGPVAMEHAHAR